MTTPLSSNLDTAIKRLVTAAMDQPWPSVELRAALNHYLTLKRSPLRLREYKEAR